MRQEVSLSSQEGALSQSKVSYQNKSGCPVRVPETSSAFKTDCQGCKGVRKLQITICAGEEAWWPGGRPGA